MNVNELKIGDFVKYKVDTIAGVEFYQGEINQFLHDEVRLIYAKGLKCETILWINTKHIISKIETIVSSKEIPVEHPKPLNVSFTIHPSMVDIQNDVEDEFDKLFMTRDVGATCIVGNTGTNGRFRMDVPFKLKLNPNKFYKFTIEEIN